MTLSRWLTWCCCAALVACGKADSERALSYERLTSGTVLDQPLQMAEFTPVGTPMPATNTFSGRLRLHTDEQSNQFDLLLDEFGLVTPSRPGIDELPRFDIQLVQDESYLVPMVQGPVINEHGWWELVLRPGRVWDEEGDNGFTRAAMPLALKEIREDCIHNGLMSFLFSDDGQVSQVAFQISNQTCRYLQFEMRGLLSASYEPGAVDDAESVISNLRDNRLGRMPQKPIEFLAQDYEGASTTEFGSHEEIDPADMTAYGFVIDGTHYVGGCETPYGIYPYCDEMALPSYSTAKSVVGGLGLMLMEVAYPGTAGATISDYVPECAAGWDDVTIEHALDMTTGHFGSSNLHDDENSSVNSRFFAGDHDVKIDVACNEFPRKVDPGVHLSYHTWDTYLAGVAMNGLLRSHNGPDADFFDDLLVEKIWKPLGLSQLAAATRRTYDDVAQPYTGFGLTLLRDDIAKLALFIGEADGHIGNEEILDRRLFDAVKQPHAGDPGMIAELPTIHYNNGFRSFDVSSYLGCDERVWVVVLSGFGGIIVAVMPNDTVYYYFSDGNVHRYLRAVRESHRIRPMCQ